MAMNQPPSFQILIFVGYASNIHKKGANESFIVTNDFRDILIEPMKPSKKKTWLTLILKRAVNLCI